MVVVAVVVITKRSVQPIVVNVAKYPNMHCTHAEPWVEKNFNICTMLQKCMWELRMGGLCGHCICEE